MKKVLFVAVLLAAVYFGWQKLSHSFRDTALEPLYEMPYVVVYGRNQCGHTKRCLKALKGQEIEAVYEIIDKREVADELHARMQQAGFDTRSYWLPVVDVNGHLFIRPDLEIILAAYRNYK